MTREIVTFVVDYPDSTDFDSIDWSTVVKVTSKITLQPIGHVPAETESAASTDGLNEATVFATVKPGDWFLDADGDLNYARKCATTRRDGTIEVGVYWMSTSVPKDERHFYTPDPDDMDSIKSGQHGTDLTWTPNDASWTETIWRIK